MKFPNSFTSTLVLSASAFAASTSIPPALAAPTKTPAYHLAATWKLAGDGFWDYLTVDAKAHRLYIPRDTRIEVVDTRSGRLIGAVKGFEEAHGVALVPALGLGFATSGGGNCVLAFDLQTLARVGEPIPVGEGPDAIAYEPTTKSLFTMNGDGKNTSVIRRKNPERRRYDFAWHQRRIRRG